MQDKGGESLQDGRRCARSGIMSTRNDSKRQRKGRPRNHSRYGWHPGALRLRRYALGLSAEALAELVAEATGGKVSRGAVGTWERGQHIPESATVEALASILGCEPWDRGREPAVGVAQRAEAAEEEEPRPRPRGGGHPRAGWGPNKSLRLTPHTPFLVYLPNDREQ